MPGSWRLPPQNKCAFQERSFLIHRNARSEELVILNYITSKQKLYIKSKKKLHIKSRNVSVNLYQSRSDERVRPLVIARVHQLPRLAPDLERVLEERQVTVPRAGSRRGQARGRQARGDAVLVQIWSEAMIVLLYLVMLLSNLPHRTHMML